jgi:molybdate transport system substrate-binding protein
VRRALAAVVTTGVLAACSSTQASTQASPQRGSPRGSITVAAAASLTGTFTALAQRFEHDHPGTTVKLDFGGSPMLATQIDEGAPFDVFASAAPKDMRTVTEAGNAAGAVTFARNTAEIAVPAANAKHVASLADLARPGVRVALCESSVPCGAVADAVLAKAHLAVTPATRQPDVKATLNVVQSGEVDAGIVYVTDVRAAGAKVTGIAIPAADDVATDYPIAVCTHTQNRALAQAFVDYVRSATGRSLLAAAGFGTP